MTTRLFPEFVLIRWKGISTLERGAPMAGSRDHGVKASMGKTAANTRPLTLYTSNRPETMMSR